MAGTSMKTDVAVLQKASANITTAVADLNGSIKKLQGEFGDLAAVWIGSGSSQFTSLASTYVDRNNKLQKVLDDISTAVNDTAKLQDANEQDVLAAVRTTSATLV